MVYLGRTVTIGLKRGTAWLSQALRNIESSALFDSVRKGESWMQVLNEMNETEVLCKSIQRAVEIADNGLQVQGWYEEGIQGLSDTV